LATALYLKFLKDKLSTNWVLATVAYNAWSLNVNNKNAIKFFENNPAIKNKLPNEMEENWKNYIIAAIAFYFDMNFYDAKKLYHTVPKDFKKILYDNFKKIEVWVGEKKEELSEWIKKILDVAEEKDKLSAKDCTDRVDKVWKKAWFKWLNYWKVIFNKVKKSEVWWTWLTATEYANIDILNSIKPWDYLILDRAFEYKQYKGEYGEWHTHWVLVKQNLWNWKIQVISFPWWKSSIKEEIYTLNSDDKWYKNEQQERIWKVMQIKRPQKN
jgi:hypothetical protein